MDVVVTGSSGLIGSRLVSTLREHGHQVVRLVRSGGGPDTARWDLDAGTIDAEALEGPTPSSTSRARASPRHDGPMPRRPGSWARGSRGRRSWPTRWPG